MDTLQLHDRKFKLAIPYDRIERAVADLARRINGDYAAKDTPLFLGVLNGSFMFMAELMKHIDLSCEVSFVKLASYCGTSSTGEVSELIGLAEGIRGRHVIVVEDIVDTGHSIEHMVRLLREYAPQSVAVATLLFKPDAYRKSIPLDYYAMAVPDRFIVGFGLDYDRLGRNLKDIYEVIDE